MANPPTRNRPDPAIAELKEALKEHAASAQQGMSRIHDDLLMLSGDVKANTQGISEMKSTLQRLPTELAKLEVQVEEVRRDTDDQWGHITTIRDSITTRVSSDAWLTKDNARLIILIVGVIVVGLFSLAGYNFFTDFKHMEPIAHVTAK